MVLSLLAVTIGVPDTLDMFTLLDDPQVVYVVWLSIFLIAQRLFKVHSIA